MSFRQLRSSDRENLGYLYLKRTLVTAAAPRALKFTGLYDCLSHVCVDIEIEAIFVADDLPAFHLRTLGAVLVGLTHRGPRVRGHGAAEASRPHRRHGVRNPPVGRERAVLPCGQLDAPHLAVAGPH